MEIAPSLAQSLGNIALAWYSHALDESEAVREIEASLVSHGHEELLVPPDDWPEAHT